MTPLARALPAWLVRASPSRWLICTIRLGYAIQFAKRPPNFTGVYFTRVNPLSAPVLREEIAALLAKGAIKPAPPAEMESGFFSPYFIVPKKSGGSRPILLLRLLRLQVNRENCKLTPVQRISFLGMELDSITMVAQLSEERARLLLNCPRELDSKLVVPLKFFQRLLGHMASAAAVTPLGLLLMRPLQHWLHDRVLRRPWHAGTQRVSVTALCCRALSPWNDPSFLQAGEPLEQASSHVVVSTDASNTGWGAVCRRHAAKGAQLHWHINRLELLAVFLALHRFLLVLEWQHVLVRMDSTSAAMYINCMGGMRSRRMSQLTRRLLLWSHPRLKSPARHSRSRHAQSCSMENGESTPSLFS
ncbi:uncharacterized protein [Danio rerio]|uniref:Uncharacterized protein n=1 Tax=Danio rerio TaxID=7955 RepID=A0AC58JM40_DANRE